MGLYFSPTHKMCMSAVKTSSQCFIKSEEVKFLFSLFFLKPTESNRRGDKGSITAQIKMLNIHNKQFQFFLPAYQWYFIHFIYVILFVQSQNKTMIYL